MSDYGDDISDDGEWFYIEEEYMVADDLAEHAVASPTGATYADEDMLDDWDRFDYFNDLEYASDGYDNATFEVHNAKDVKSGQKRKCSTTKISRKKRKSEALNNQADNLRLEHSPVVWHAQTDRERKPKILDDDTEPYTLWKNWREMLVDAPHWARASPKALSCVVTEPTDRMTPPLSESLPPSFEGGEGQEEDVIEEAEDEAVEIDKNALMAALERQLAAAGGPLSGMNPQQLLQFALRMAADKDAGDEIAGEMAEAILEGDDEEDDADAGENLLSWAAQQRHLNKSAEAEAAEQSDTKRAGKKDGQWKGSKEADSDQANQSKKPAKAASKSSLSKPREPSANKHKRKADAIDKKGDTEPVKKRLTEPSRG